MKSFTHNGQKFVYDEEVHKAEQIYNLKKDIEILEHELANSNSSLRAFTVLALEDAKRRLAAL